MRWFSVAIAGGAGARPIRRSRGRPVRAWRRPRGFRGTAPVLVPAASQPLAREASREPAESGRGRHLAARCPGCAAARHWRARRDRWRPGEEPRSGGRHLYFATERTARQPDLVRQAGDPVGDGWAGAVVSHGHVAARPDRVAPSLEDHLLTILAPAAALGDHCHRRRPALHPARQVRQLLGVPTFAAHRDRPPLAIDGELTRRSPHPAAPLDPRRRPPNQDAMRDRRRRRRRPDGSHTTKSHALDASPGQPRHGSLAPHPRRPRQPARRLELRDMPPNHSLIEIQPNLHRP